MTILSLKNSKEFDLVSKYGTKKHGTYLLIIFAPNFTHIASSSLNSAFLGMKVSKKLSKKATVRNKIKRHIRHLLRNAVKDPAIDTNNKAFIIIPKKNFQTASFKALTNDFQNTIIKASSQSY